jgi:hypothetical protein
MRTPVVRLQPEPAATASIQMVFTTDAVFAAGLREMVALCNRQVLQNRGYWA